MKSCFWVHFSGVYRHGAKTAQNICVVFCGETWIYKIMLKWYNMVLLSDWPTLANVQKLTDAIL